jgi:hypothetical protein
MMRSRSYIRYQAELKKKEAARRNKFAYTPRLVGILATTPHPCSCIGCGHARFWYGETRQEKAVKLDYEQELTDMLTDYTWWHDVYGRG